LQLNIPMAVYVVWSVYRANTLLKRAKNAESQIEADASNSVPQSAQEKRVNA
ncbi:MAG TPA: peptidase, partial [Alteromonas macleodii]|nr:peptidase [Alteromonas macleodii]